MDAGGGLLGDAADVGGQLVPMLMVALEGAAEDAEHGAPLLVVAGAGGGDGAGLLVLDALVHQQGGVAAIVQEHVGAAAVGPVDHLLGAPPVLLQGLALPGIDGDAAGGDGGGGVVLGGEDVAGAPADLGPQIDQGLDEDRGLDGHVQAATDAGPGEGPGGGIFAADGHETGHLGLGDGDLLAAPIGQGNIGDLVVGELTHAGTPGLV